MPKKREQIAKKRARKEKKVIGQRRPMLEDSKILGEKRREILVFLEAAFQSIIGKVPGYQLVFKASEHGFRAAAFHRACDLVRNTLTIIRLTNGRLFAGFTPICWLHEIDP
jgi:hypothetical protein